MLKNKYAHIDIHHHYALSKHSQCLKQIAFIYTFQTKITQSLEIDVSQNTFGMVMTEGIFQIPNQLKMFLKSMCPPISNHGNILEKQIY
jgi:hypothetical protein